MRYRVGIDTGGTFTDVVLFDQAERQVHITKTHSTPENPAVAVVNGIAKISGLLGIAPHGMDFLVHGTTVATNALLEYKGIETALVVTRGFKDVLSIARQTRPKLYDWFVKRPEPLIPRHLRYEISERMAHTGEVIEPLDENEVRAVADDLKAREITSVAVCLLHSYANGDHERRIREIFEERHPGAKVCISCEVLRETREYERMSTTVINAYVMPIIERYLGYVRGKLREQGMDVELNIMQSNGGIMTAETAGRKSVNTILSGPAGGVIGCLAIANRCGIENSITIDMGGTSFDISLIHKRTLNYKTESEIAGHPVNAPMIDIHTIGAGGGSIAWIDQGGALRVGPQSAGASPGPVCYGRGGTAPTVTDANLVLGRLNPEYYLGGEVKVDVGAARRAITEKIAAPLGLSLEQAADGILRVVNATMIRGIRTVSVEKGYDAREFSIVSFGGAASLHAVDLARELEAPEVVIPLYPGVNSALGLLMADFRYDYSLTFLQTPEGPDPSALGAAFAELESEAAAQMAKEKIPPGDVQFIRTADIRYAGQAYQLNIPVPGGELRQAEVKAVEKTFHDRHRALYGYDRPRQAIEFVYLRLSAVAELTKPELPVVPSGSADPSSALKGHRRVFLAGSWMDTAMYERDRLSPGNSGAGPAIIEQFDTTTLVSPGQTWTVDEYRNIRIRI